MAWAIGCGLRLAAHRNPHLAHLAPKLQTDSEQNAADARRTGEPILKDDLYRIFAPCASAGSGGLRRTLNGREQIND
jgi:hypothetical protein